MYTDFSPLSTIKYDVSEPVKYEWSKVIFWIATIIPVGLFIEIFQDNVLARKRKIFGWAY